ncbi:protein MROH8-like isoform X3 [Mauremys reevesii]|uniref:protein MROH8-like isoform X3 n=1 Tax=Mauremys reevesii TaxID=260615 RepID=UPI00193F8351|nr:protein MROH8-like isoform X3 [Mauremys reevesii]
MPELLDAMLGNLLAESPDTDRLHYILEISAEFPRMGHHVAQLALFVSDPDKDIGQQAREGTYRLHQLLLQQRGLTIHEAEDLWCHDWHRDSRLLGYKNTARVEEVFGKFFSEGQRKYFLQTAMLAIHDPLLHISQAGLLLTYSILGEAQQLMGDKLEDVIAKVMCQLRIIQHLHQVSEALQGLRLI